MKPPALCGDKAFCHQCSLHPHFYYFSLFTYPDMLGVYFFSIYLSLPHLSPWFLYQWLAPVVLGRTRLEIYSF